MTSLRARARRPAGLATAGDRGRANEPAPAAANREALLRARDLYRIPLWALQKPLYAFAPVSFHLRAAELRGMIQSLKSSRRAKVMQLLERHLGDAAGPRELQRIARRYFECRGRRRVIQNWPEIRGFSGVESVPIMGLEHLDAALERGNGAILATAHFGHVRLIKPILRSCGRPALIVAARMEGSPTRRTRIGDLVHSTLLGLPRGAHSEQWATTSGTDIKADFNLRPIVAALERNEAVIILVDGGVAQTLYPISVAGIEIPLAPGVVTIARSTRAPVLPTFAVSGAEQTSPGGIRLVIRPALDFRETENRPADVEVNLRRFAAVYEREMRAHPDNFFWSWVRNGAFSSPQARKQSARSGGRRRGL